MGVWLVDADVLAASRFVTSPLIETVSVPGSLATRDSQPWDRAWLARHRAAFSARASSDPFSSSLINAALAGSWLPVDLGPPPRPADISFDLELARLRTVHASVARADLSWSIGGGPLPAALDVPIPRVRSLTCCSGRGITCCSTTGPGGGAFMRLTSSAGQR